MRPPVATHARLPFLVATIGLLLAASPARAGHYDLSSIDLFEEAAVSRLASMKVFTTQDLWEATRTPAKVKATARRSGLAQARLRDLHELCDLLWIDGIGPKVARVLTTAGVKNLAALARQEPIALADLIKETNRKVEILGKLPDPDTTRSWIEQAKARIKAGARPIAPSHP